MLANHDFQLSFFHKDAILICISLTSLSQPCFLLLHSLFIFIKPPVSFYCIFYWFERERAREEERERSICCSLIYAFFGYLILLHFKFIQFFHQAILTILYFYKTRGPVHGICTFYCPILNCFKSFKYKKQTMNVCGVNG